MRFLRLIIATAVATATLVLAGASPAMACTCAAPLTDGEALANSDATFVGVVSERYDARSGSSGDDHPAVFVLTVSDVYDGAVTSEVGVLTNRSGAACGFEFVIGREYVVFGEVSSSFHTHEDGWFAVGLCSGTRLLSDGPVEIDGSPATPIEGEVSEGAIQRHLGSVRPSLFPEIFIFAGVIVFVLSLVAWLNRKGRTVA